MSIRVIAGRAKGRRLKPVPGNKTRPIMDRVKEALFSIIGRNIVDAVFLDLFAGTGSVGIEALSRGAAQVVFVERDRLALRTIRANLGITGLEANAVVQRTDVFSFLKKPPPEIFDYIFLAPPQYKGLWADTLNALDANPAWISQSTQVIVQIDPKEWNPSLSWQHLQVYDERRYGKTTLVFCHQRNGEPVNAAEEKNANG